MIRYPYLSTGIVLMLLGLLPGCATVSRPVPLFPDHCWTDAEQLEERIRSLPVVTEDQTLLAAERLLRLTGSEDSRITRSQHSVTAEFNRNRWIYLFLVAHHANVRERWVIATRPEAGGVSVCVAVRGHYFTDTFVLGAEPISNALYPASATDRDPGWWMPPARSYAVDFDTFWARLEYLLGLNPTWASCPSGGSGGIRKNEVRGRMEMNPLCHTLAEDPSPPDVREEKRRTPFLN